MRFSTFSTSSLGKKIYMGVMGLILSSFLIVHLLGNLALLSGNKDHFNEYSHFLTQSTGNAIYVIEILFGLFFLIHLVYGIVVTWGNWKARPIGYKKVTNAKGASKKSFASTTMIYSGVLLLIFFVIHLLNFKYGEEIMYVTKDGATIRDLYATVVHFFTNTWNVVFYVAVIVFFGFHLSHGVWSAFQSLGVNAPRFIRFMQIIAPLFAFILTVAFAYIPIFIYLTGGAQ